MESIKFEIPKDQNPKKQESENRNNIPFNPEVELNRPSLSIFNVTKAELGKLFGYGLRTIEQGGDAELMSEINRHFFTNRGKMEEMKRQWQMALSDVNKDAEKVEKQLAENFAQYIFDFITTESKIKDKFNN